MDWEYYQLHRFMHQDPNRWLHNKDGSLVTIANQSVFDFTRDDVGIRYFLSFLSVRF
jgi:hypothetical protein